MGGKVKDDYDDKRNKVDEKENKKVNKNEKEEKDNEKKDDEGKVEEENLKLMEEEQNVISPVKLTPIIDNHEVSTSKVLTPNIIPSVNSSESPAFNNYGYVNNEDHKTSPV